MGSSTGKFNLSIKIKYKQPSIYNTHIKFIHDKAGAHVPHLCRVLSLQKDESTLRGRGGVSGHGPV
jgi:hypothetical protein